MMWVITFPGMLIIPLVVTILVQIAHRPLIRENRRRLAERAAAEASAAEGQPKKTSASA